MVRFVVTLWLLSILAAGMSWAQPARADEHLTPPVQNEPPAAAPATPKVFNINRFVPTGIERRLAFVVTVFPDCSSRGATVGRIVTKPSHGAVSLDADNSFPDFPLNSRISSCNEKKMPGLSINYKSDAEYVGDDEMEILLLLPDGTAATWHYTIIVK